MGCTTELKNTSLDDQAGVNSQTLRVGQLLLVLPGYSLTGHFRQGDLGTIRGFYEEGASGQDRFRVVWQRTGRGTNHPVAGWMTEFSAVRHQVLGIGDLLQALSGRSLVANRTSY